MRRAGKGAARGRPTLRALTRLWFCGVPLHIGWAFGGGGWIAEKAQTKFFGRRQQLHKSHERRGLFTRAAGDTWRHRLTRL
jgi:hypothetical protein